MYLFIQVLSLANILLLLQTINILYVNILCS
jgi:hypothetical protein